jgi:hypothetical protein
MWMNVYLEDTLVREQIADAQRRAARNHLLRHARPPRAPHGGWELVLRLLRRRTQATARRAFDGSATLTRRAR